MATRYTQQKEDGCAEGLPQRAICFACAGQAASACVVAICQMGTPTRVAESAPPRPRPGCLNRGGSVAHFAGSSMVTLLVQYSIRRVHSAGDHPLSFLMMACLPQFSLNHIAVGLLLLLSR